MLRPIVAASLVFLSLLPGRAVGANEPSLPATSLVPGDAIVVLRVTNPRALIEQAFSPQVVALVESLPSYQEALARPETQQGLGVIRFFENKYDATLPQLLGRLLGGGITLAILPGEQNLLIVEAEDAQMLADVHEFFRTIARGEAAKQGDPDRIKSAEYRGIQGWSFAPSESHAIVGNKLLLASQPQTLKAALDRLTGAEAGSIVGAAGFVAAGESLSPAAVMTLYADMRMIKRLPGFRQALQQNENPLGRLIFEPLLAGANQASWLAAGVALGSQELTVEVLADRGDGSSPALSGFAVPPTSGEGAMPNLVVPRQIAAMSLYRDLRQFYAAKDELFGERTSGLIFFENMMGIFFTGRDLTEEVLAQTWPLLRVVVAEQAYDVKTGTPATRLPGVAVIIKLRDPENFHLVIKEAWQKAIGLINFTRGQQALPGLIIDSATHRGTTYTTAFFSVADEPDKNAVDVRFNFQPALAVQGDYLIMSSSDILARDLIEAVEEELRKQVTPLSGKHTVAMLQGPALASVLRANRGAMVRQNMVEKGHSREGAESEVDGILAALQHLDRVDMQSSQKNGFTQVTLSVGYRLP